MPLPAFHYPPINYKVPAGSFRVSVIHRTLIWTAGSLTCLRDHSYTHVYTRGLGIATTSQYIIVDTEKLSQLFLVLLTGVRRSLDPEANALPPRHPLDFNLLVLLLLLLLLLRSTGRSQICSPTDVVNRVVRRRLSVVPQSLVSRSVS